VPSALVATGASLLVIDPLLAFVYGNTDKDNETRMTFLTPMAQAAARTGACILLIAHPTKGEQANLIRQHSGSFGIAAAVRSALFVATDPANAGERVVAHYKANFSRPGDAFSFRLREEIGLAYPTIEPGRVRPEHYLGEGLNPTSQRRRTSRYEQPAEVARELLEGKASGVSSREVRQHVREATGFEIPAEGGGLTRFLEAAGIVPRPVNSEGVEGRTGSLWALRHQAIQWTAGNG